MNTKDNQRSRLTKMLMKQSFLKLMSDKPASKITVKDICEGAQVNRSTFYLHYVEPNDILMELEDDAISLVAESLSSIANLNDGSPNTLPYLSNFLHYIQRNDELFRALLVENSDPHFRKKLQAYSLNIAETTFKAPLSSEQKAIVFRFIVSGSIELLSNWINNDYDISDKTMCDVLFRLCEGCLRNFVES